MVAIEAIAVTGTPFSGKTTLAKVLAEELNWKYFSVSDMWKAEWKKKYPKGDTGFDNFMLQVADDDHKKMDKRAGDLLRQGHVVADMSFGFLYRHPQILIVFTQCELDDRVKRALELNRYPERNFSQVKEILEQSERDEVDRCQALYGTDFRSEKNYDMLIDTTASPPDEAVQSILKVVK